MIEAVKLALRLTSPAFDDEITDLIEACKIDLQLAGIVKIKDSDPLIKRAVTLYAKAYFGFVEDGEKYKQSYDSLKISLCLAGDYNHVQRRDVRNIPKKTEQK
jgi:hypothetical protein